MKEGQYHPIEDGALAVRLGKIVWIGPKSEMPEINAKAHHHFEGGIVMPGFIDCHTHLVFGGDRSAEFEKRLNGVSYAQIAAEGGGIISTVRATRTASENALLNSARQRLSHLLAEGVTTIEIKSGYGLDIDNEIKMLRVIRRLGEHSPVEVYATCLAAHAIPPSFLVTVMRGLMWSVNNYSRVLLRKNSLMQWMLFANISRLVLHKRNVYFTPH